MSKYRVVDLKSAKIPNLKKLSVIAYIMREGDEQPLQLVIDNVSSKETVDLFIKKFIDSLEQEDESNARQAEERAEEERVNGIIEAVKEDVVEQETTKDT